jgi:RNA polymerase sigma factor (sigma-70 family)
MLQDVSFQQVLDQLRQQDDAAASKVYQRFAQRLIALARTRLDDRLLQRVDAEDVVQSVFKSVFLRLADGQFVLGDWEGLWALLTAVAVHKCRKWVDYYQAQGRDLNREVAVGPDSSWQVIDREPSPSEALTLKETLEQVLKGLKPSEQEMVTLSLQGYQVAEVSGQLGCTESKVYRVLALVRKRLERMREVDS